MFTKQKLPEEKIFQIQSFPLFQKLADCHFFSFRKIQRHFDVSIFPIFSPPHFLHKVGVITAQSIAARFRVITATTGCVGTAGRREQNGQPFSLRHITPSPACMGSWAHPPVWTPFQTLYIYLHVFESFKRKYFATGEFSGKPLVPFIGFCTVMTKVSQALLILSHSFEEVRPVKC